MTLEGNEYKNAAIVRESAAVLYREIEEFNRLGSSQQGLKGYLGFRILEALYKFEKSQEIQNLAILILLYYFTKI